MICRVLSLVFPLLCASAFAEETAALSPGHLRLAADYSRGHGGLSLLVLKDGARVFEEYHNGHRAEDGYALASGTKSFVGVLALQAVDDGLIGLEEKVSDTLHEWRSDPRKAIITVRQLLDLSSGLDPAKELLQGSEVKDKYARAISLEATARPGQRFRYGPGHYYAFGAFLARKLAAQKTPESFEGYLKRRLLAPLGIEPRFWQKDAAGSLALPAGAVLTARSWARFGEMIRRGGVGPQGRVVQARSLSACFRPSAAKVNYGLTFWLLGTKPQAVENRAQGSGFPRDAVMAAGKGKQRCYVIRSAGLTIVRQGVRTTPAFSDGEFFGRLLFGRAKAVTVAKRQPAILAVAGRAKVAAQHARLDRDGDGLLERPDLPAVPARAWERSDLDGDGGIDVHELVLLSIGRASDAARTGGLGR